MEIINELKKIIEESNAPDLFIEKIPKKKIENAVKAYAKKLIYKEHEIILLVDSTFWGSAKTGIVFTKDAMFWKDSLSSDMGSIHFKDIQSLKISKDSFSSKIITVNHENIELVGVPSSTLLCTYKIIIFLQKLSSDSKIRLYKVNKDTSLTDRAYELQCLMFKIIADGVFTKEESHLWKTTLRKLGYIDENGEVLEEHRKELLHLKSLTLMRFAEEINRDGTIDDLEKLQTNVLIDMMMFFEEDEPSLGKVPLNRTVKKEQKKSSSQVFNKSHKQKEGRRILKYDDVEPEVKNKNETKKHSSGNEKKSEKNVDKKTYDQLREEKIEEINAIFRKSPAAIAKFLPQMVILKFMIDLIGGDFKKYADYYSRLLFCFTKDHPTQAGILIVALANIITSDTKNAPSFLSAGAAVGIGASILSYRNELQKKDIRSVLKKFSPSYDFRDICQKGKVFTNDGKTFFEVISKFGDPPKSFVKFTLSPEGKRRYDREEIQMGEKYCSDSDKRKAFVSFVKDQKLYDVTECMRPDSKSVRL